MIGGLTKTTSRLAIASVIAAFESTGAMAADLGGDCCSDLEERVAELEATTEAIAKRLVVLVSPPIISISTLWFQLVAESITRCPATARVGTEQHARACAQAAPTKRATSD